MNIGRYFTGLVLATCLLVVGGRAIGPRAQYHHQRVGHDGHPRPAWAELYMKERAGVTIQVTGGGSGTGIAALVNGTTDIAEASRPMKTEEIEMVSQKQGKEVLELPVAVDGLAVYLHEQNPIDELTIEQLKGIYTGSIKNWKDVGGNDERILLYGRENNSGTYAYFKEHVLAKPRLLSDGPNASRHGGGHQRGLKGSTRHRLRRYCLRQRREAPEGQNRTPVRPESSLPWRTYSKPDIPSAVSFIGISPGRRRGI